MPQGVASIREWSSERETAMARTLAAAFPSFDASEEVLKDQAEAPADRALREVVPPPVRVPFEQLVAEAGQHRVLVFRGRLGVPVEVLLSVGGALLLHLLIFGLFLIGFYFAVRTPLRMVSDGGMSADIGGGPAGLVISEGSGASDSAATDDPLGLAGIPALPPVPSLPRLPEQLSTPAEIATNQLASASDAVPFAMRSSLPDLGQVKIRPTGQLTSTDSAGAGAVNPVAGGGDPGGLGDEPTFVVGRGDQGGGGGGRGGRGIGPGYGPSGANFPEPRILFDPMPAQVRVTKKAITLEVQVLASGQIGSIKIVESCGESEVDEFYRNVVSGWKFYPAIIAGKPVTESKKITLEPFRE